MEELLSLKWNNHRSTFLHILGVLRDKQAYTDVTLACDGKFYNVHKLVLSTCSDYFSAMFDKTDKTCKSPIIVLKDIKCEDLESLLDYMYLGEVNVRQCDLASLIKSAECLRVKGLAVPDDEPPKKVPNRTESNRRDHVSESNRRDHVSESNRRDHVSGSPPPKRKRRDEGEDGRDDVRPIMHSSPISSSRPKSPISQRLSPSPHRTAQPSTAVREERISHPFSSPTDSHPQPVAAASNAVAADAGEKSRTEENPSLVKVETIDCDDDDGPTEIQDDSFDMGNDSYKEEGDSGGGAGDFNSDLPEFLQAAAAGSLGNYSHASFPGPSNFQPGDISGWQGEGSSMGFPAHLNYTSDGSSQQAPGVDLGALGTGPSAGGISCPTCGKMFLGKNQRQLLRRHALIHTGEKPHGCAHCPYRTNQKCNLNMHIATVHRGTNIISDRVPNLSMAHGVTRSPQNCIQLRSPITLYQPLNNRRSSWEIEPRPSQKVEESMLQRQNSTDAKITTLSSEEN